jgi:hypothetical protein
VCKHTLLALSHRYTIRGLLSLERMVVYAPDAVTKRGEAPGASRSVQGGGPQSAKPTRPAFDRTMFHWPAQSTSRGSPFGSQAKRSKGSASGDKRAHRRPASRTRRRVACRMAARPRVAHR